MATIGVMISSRCADPVPDKVGDVSLSDIRRTAKEAIEAIMARGKKRAFEVWISEEGDPGPGSMDAWDLCMQQARECDILVCLYNGHSGWAPPGSSIGICQAELQVAVDAAPEKVRLIKVEPDRSRTKSPEQVWDQAFHAYVERLALYRGGEVAKDAQEVVASILGAVRSAVVDFTRSAARGSRMHTSYQGEALDWNRLDFASRKRQMEDSIIQELLTHQDSHHSGDHAVVVPVAGKAILLVCHAIPAPLTVAHAREMVGQPFLRDHLYLGGVKSESCGPVHLIACYGNVSDSQARRQLGFPDATIVAPPFGAWVADPVQKIQMLFLAGCVDSITTRGQTARAFEWLTRTGEDELLASRAQSRAHIVQTINAEMLSTRQETPSARTRRGGIPSPRQGPKRRS